MVVDREALVEAFGQNIVLSTSAAFLYDWIGSISCLA
jgi:hypothetical protein